MSLFNTKKLDHLTKAKGKYIGASTKETNYVYGRKKAQKVAMSKALNKAKHENKD